jgi:hypothetical protein
MVFEANENAEVYFKKYKTSALLVGVGFAAFVVMEVVGNYE